MRVLLDTNIVIHREANKGGNRDIGILFKWLDKIHAEKCIHPISVEELSRFKDPEAVDVMGIKLDNYNELKTTASFEGKIKAISDQLDSNGNDVNDSRILNEVYEGRVDYLISEDRKIHKKALLLNIPEKIFTINDFLEKVTAEHPDLIDYKVLAVKKEYFGNISLADPFFDSFREDYKGFDSWFKKKSDEIAYVCYQDGILSAFLFVKTEFENENYSDIAPPFISKKRLKIGTFKVTSNGYKIGERFLKIIFDNAFSRKVDEIYVTIFDKRPEQQRLIELLQDWGFTHHGIKATENGKELVFVKPFKSILADRDNPRLTYPFTSDDSDVYIVSIYPEYHTELFPDSVLRTESPLDFVENQPHRNALRKVYISRSREKGMKPGDLIVFYRTGGIYAGVATTVGIIESVVTDIPDVDTFISLCRKRSVFTDEELKAHWNYNSRQRPFIVNFLYAGSFRKRPNLKWLNETGIIPDITNMPRGFHKISRRDFVTIVEYSRT